MADNSGIRIGQGAFIGIGETAFATNGTKADIKLTWNIDDGADSMQVERDIIEFNDLTSQWKNAATIKEGHRRVTGSVTLKATGGGLQDILRMVTGHNVTVSGSSPYTYDFVPPNWSTNYWLANTKGLCIEVFRGGTQGTDDSVFYQGCQISELSMKFEPGSFVELSMSFIGRGYTIGTSSVMGTVNTTKTDYMVTTTGQNQSSSPFLQLDPGDGLDDYVCKSATITLTPGIDVRNDVTGVEGLLPYPTGKWEVKLDADIEVKDDTMLDKLNNPSDASGTSGRFIQGKLHLDEGSYDLTWLFDALTLQSPAESRTAGIGVTTTSVSFDVWKDSGSEAFTCTLVNLDSDYIL